MQKERFYPVDSKAVKAFCHPEKVRCFGVLFHTSGYSSGTTIQIIIIANTVGIPAYFQ